MYCFMENKNLLPEEQKGCRRKSRGTKDQLVIDESVTLEILDMLGIADNARRFLEKSMKNWKLLLNSNGSDFCEVDVNRSLLFV